MIEALIFGEYEIDESGVALRTARFERRSTLPASAACVVANGVRETLGRVLGRALDVDVVEPSMPGAAARRTLLDGAIVQRVRGKMCDAFVLVRPLDARRLVAYTYGESERSDAAALSEIERTTLDRIVATLLPLCSPLCGEIRSHAREPVERMTHDVRTYFEVRAGGETPFAIGFALSIDPPEAVGPTLTVEDLLDLEIPVRAIFARGSLAVPAFARLTPGDVVRLDTVVGAPGHLEIGGVRFGRGACGTRDGRSVIAFGRVNGGRISEDAAERGAA